MMPTKIWGHSLHRGISDMTTTICVKLADDGVQVFTKTNGTLSADSFSIDTGTWDDNICGHAQMEDPSDPTADWQHWGPYDTIGFNFRLIDTCGGGIVEFNLSGSDTDTILRCGEKEFLDFFEQMREGDFFTKNLEV